MFSVIVSGGLEEHRGPIAIGRVFEHTDDAIAARFKPDGQLDTGAVLRLPTIFMNEGVDDEIARIGWLTRVERRRTEYELQYSYDREIQPLTNADIRAMAGALRMDDWEFSRNHWAIKDVDLFEALYRQNHAHGPAPRVFQL